MSLRFFTDFFHGIRYLRHGVSLSLHPQLRRFVMIPLAINVVVFSAAIYALSQWFFSLLSGSGQWLADFPFLQWLSQFVLFEYLVSLIMTLIWAVFSLAALLIAGYLFSLIGNIIAAPFNGLLAENCESLLRGEPIDTHVPFAEVMRSAPKVIAAELGKLWYLAWWLLPLLILSWIPVIGLLAPFLGLAFGAWMLAIEYVDYPMSQHRFLFKDIKQALGAHRGLAFGFGGSAALMASVPVLNLVVMPVAVCGATKLWVEKEHSLRQAVTPT